MNIKEIILAEQGKRPPGRPFDLPSIEGGGGGGGGFGGSSVAPRGGSVQAVPGSSSGLVMPTGKLGTVPRTTPPATPTPGNVNPAMSPKEISMQKQIDDLSKTVSNLPKKQTIANKLGWGAAKTLGAGAALVGAGEYALRPDPANYTELLARKKAERIEREERKTAQGAEQKTADNSQSATTDSPMIGTTPNSTQLGNTDNDNPFSALKTNEDFKELDRVKHLARFRN